MRRSSLLFGLDNRPTVLFATFLRDMQIPGDDLPSIDVALQTRFFQKNPDGTPKERWELDGLNIECSTNRIRWGLAVCGFLNEIKPSNQSYTYAAWPGALVIRAIVRLNDLVRVWENGVRWEKTIVFGGKRPLQTDKENYEACCKALTVSPEDGTAHSLWQSINPQTELDMMRWLWLNFGHPIRGKDQELFSSAQVVFVDTPMKPPLKEGGSPIRPNTEDTIQEWLRNNPKPGSVLLSSGAPYGMAQDEAFWTLLEPHGFTVETFGHAAPDLPTEVFMRKIAGCVNRIRRARIM